MALWLLHGIITICRCRNLFSWRKSLCLPFAYVAYHEADVLWSYIALEDLGLTEDRNRALFEGIQKLTLDDVKAFQEKWVKGRNYTYCILGNEKELDMKSLSKYGTITRLTTEDIFGY